MNIRNILFFFLVTLAISCSEYSSEYPIGSLQNSYAKGELYGAWDYIWSSEGEDDPHKLLIYKYNDKEYLVLFVPENPDDSDDVIAMKSYLSRIGKNEFANSRLLSDQLNDEEAEFVIHKIKMEGDKLVLSGIPAKLLESLEISFSSMEEHKDFIAENAENLPFWTIRYEYRKNDNKDVEAGR